jgi:hypothetical protein
MSTEAGRNFDYDSDLPYPPLQKDARLVVMSDWVSRAPLMLCVASRGCSCGQDKTVTMFDTNDFLTDEYGKPYIAHKQPWS